jgi:uncharacterized Zn finger protein
MKKPATIRPNCPDCSMQMIVVKGAKLEPQQKTYECLRCGHVAKPGEATSPEQPPSQSDHTEDIQTLRSARGL